MKPIVFLGDALDRLRDFPERARRDAGFQLERGHEPDDWKPMTSIGQGVREIRVRDTTGAFPIIYVASIADAIFVLHAFQKKAQRTPQRDLTLAQNRFRQLKRGAQR